MENNLDARMCAESRSDLGAENPSGIRLSPERPTRSTVTSTRCRKRSARIILTNESRVLKQLRLEHGLSMKSAAMLIGVSDSTVAHIETGRMDAPKGHRLERFLRVYGNIKPKSFYERVRIFEALPLSPQQELAELIKRANDQQIQTVLMIVKGLLRQR